MEYKIFKPKYTNKLEYDFIDSLNSQFSLNPTASMLLFQKGITTFNEAENFLYPKESDFYNPFLFRDMQKFVQRIELALKRCEKVVIYGDYDCDGVCSSVILKKILDNIGVKNEIKIPNRFSSGYGINLEDINEIIKEKFSLVICVDNGITAIKEAEKLKENNIDFIIADHHTLPKTLPRAYAIINPKNEMEKYPQDNLCAAGVALKMAFALKERFSLSLEMKELIILAGIATIGDIVPLVKENRLITYLCIKYLREHPILGIDCLILKANLKKEDITCANIAFQIVPRINAVGRLNDAKIATSLLLTKDREEATVLAEKLDILNEERKEIEEKIFSKAEEIINSNNLIKEQSVLFIYNEDFNEGVMGIAAGKITEKYNCPTVILTKAEAFLKASCRSIIGFNIFDCLNNSNYLFEKFGGHSQAAGFSIKEENLEKLIYEANEYAYKRNIDRLFYKRYYYDALALPSFLNIKSISDLELFAPFGMGNAKSVFLLKNATIRNVNIIGKDKNYLKLSVLYKGNYYDAIGFNLAYLAKENNLINNNYDIIFSPSINTFNNLSKIQLELKDLAPSLEYEKEYDISLYNYFKINDEFKEIYYPKEEEILKESLETSVDKNKNKLFIIYNKDTFTRIVRYANFKNLKLNIGFNNISFEENKINVLVNPINLDEDLKNKEIIVLDSSEYSFYKKEMYENLNALFLNPKVIYPKVRITREFMLFIYKKLPMLNLINNNLYNFIDAIQNECDIFLNYFSLRVSLDAMEELKILSYEIENDNILIKFNEIKEQKDINNTKTMIKLKGRTLLSMEV